MNKPMVNLSPAFDGPASASASLRLPAAAELLTLVAAGAPPLCDRIARTISPLAGPTDPSHGGA
jgi:hypothetical protein